MKKVLIAGATGSMGRKAVQLIEKQSDYQLVAILAPNATADTQLPAAVSRFDNLADINLAADVWIDFTTPQAVFANVKFALEHQMRPIVGTSGLSRSEERRVGKQ